MTNYSALKKADRALQQEQLKQLDIIYPSSAIIWWQNYGWRETRIMRRFATSQQIWDECAADNNVSILQMLENETGIELKLREDDKSWHELAYFDTSVDYGELTLPKLIYMRQQQKKWVGASIMAGICLSLSRDEHWGAGRLLIFIQQAQAFIAELGEDTRLYQEKMLEVTGIKMSRLWNDEKEESA